MDKDTILKLVQAEFHFIYDEMKWFDFTLEEAVKSSDKMLFRSGIYVFYNQDGPLKVGKSNGNPRKRAVTGWGKLLPDPKRLLIITMNEQHLHWVYALEIFLEIIFRNTPEYKSFTPADRL